MREIKHIEIINQQGSFGYGIGQKVNGLEITRIRDVSVEYENALHVGYRCLSSNDNNSLTVVVEIWNCSVIVEYYEVPRDADCKTT